MESNRIQKFKVHKRRQNLLSKFIEYYWQFHCIDCGVHQLLKVCESHNFSFWRTLLVENGRNMRNLTRQQLIDYLLITTIIKLKRSQKYAS